MLAVVIDPIVCHSSYWWLFPECWGIAVLSGCAIGALVIAYGYRKAVSLGQPEPTRLDRLRKLGIQ
jgi:hypothetical protein